MVFSSFEYSIGNKKYSYEQADSYIIFYIQ